MTVSDMPDCRSGSNHFTQLEHRQHCLWKPLNLSLVFIRSSSSAGAHQSAGWHTLAQTEVDTPAHTYNTHTYTHNTHTHDEAHGHKVSAGASALWFLLSKGCKMEIRLNGWHGLSLPVACIIKSCSNTFECDSNRLILAASSSLLTFLLISLVQLLPTLFSARLCIEKFHHLHFSTVRFPVFIASFSHLRSPSWSQSLSFFIYFFTCGWSLCSAWHMVIRYGW